MSAERLDANGRPVAQYLCHAFHQLVRVIADADHCVGPRHVRLNQHCVESLLARSLGEFCEERDIAAKHSLQGDRKSTRLNSSHLVISYAVFCLKKKKI